MRLLGGTFLWMMLVLCSPVWSTDLEECIPYLADRCFDNFMGTVPSDHLSLGDVEKLCMEFEERLNCASDIIDGDCEVSNGLDNFNHWMNSLRQVHSYLCTKDVTGFMTLIGYNENGYKCWDLDTFTECVANKTRITHVLDMMHIGLDINECMYILIAFSSCNARATHDSSICAIHQDVISEVIQIFIKEAKCTSFCMLNSHSPSINTWNILHLVTLMILKLSQF